MALAGKNSSRAAKSVLLLSFVCLASIFLINGTLGTSSAQSEEREFIDTTPKHLPIKVKIKKEKEQAFKDLKNENWYRDLEIEVTNTGDKPIYLLHFDLTMPEIITESGYPAAFVLHYGRAELGNTATMPKAGPDDVPINPGETYVFSITGGQLLGWERYTKKHNKPLPKKVVQEFGMLTFGDGTGFWALDGTPYPNPPKGKSSLSPSQQGTGKQEAQTLELQHASPGNCSQRALTKYLPASFWPVNFLSEELSKAFSINSPSQPQVDCCPGNGCARIIEMQSFQDCDCGRTRITTASRRLPSCTYCRN